MADCSFCNPRVIERQKILETPHEFVLYNIRKGKTLGRCLVIPKRHVTNIGDLTTDEVESLFHTVWAVSNCLRKHLHPDGINFGFNEGEIAGQSVPHVHVHIMPRYINDDIPEFHLFHRDPKHKSNYSEKELQELVNQFRSVLAQS